MLKLVNEITPNIKLLWNYTPIPSYEQYIGAYLCTGKKNAVIDPGPGASIPGLINSIQAAGLQPEQIDYVILTHIHMDHAGGASTALKTFRNAKVIVHGRGVRHLVDPSALYRSSLETLGELVIKYGKIDPVPPDRIIAAEEGMVIDLGGASLQLVMTPGHAAHHLSVYEMKQRVLFSGDAAGIFHEGLLRLTTPPPFRLDEMLASLDKIIALSPHIICYGHLGAHNDAVVCLKTFRSLLLRCYEFAQSPANRVKSYTDVLDALIEKEPDWKTHFAGLNTTAHKRDYSQLTNSVTGLMTASN